METDILLAAIAGVFAILSPIVIQWRKTSDWSETLRVALPVVVSLVIAVLYLVFTTGFADGNILNSFLVIYGLQQLVYVAIVKHIQSLKTPPAEDEVTK